MDWTERKQMYPGFITNVEEGFKINSNKIRAILYLE